MNNCHNIWLPYWMVIILLYNRDFDVFLVEYWSCYTKFLFLATQIQHLADYKIVVKWLKLYKYEELTQYF